jgi:hypothetical protein
MVDVVDVGGDVGVGVRLLRWLVVIYTRSPPSPHSFLQLSKE